MENVPPVTSKDSMS